MMRDSAVGKCRTKQASEPRGGGGETLMGDIALGGFQPSSQSWAGSSWLRLLARGMWLCWPPSMSQLYLWRCPSLFPPRPAAIRFPVLLLCRACKEDTHVDIVDFEFWKSSWLQQLHARSQNQNPSSLQFYSAWMSAAPLFDCFQACSAVSATCQSILLHAGKNALLEYSSDQFLL